MILIPKFIVYEKMVKNSLDMTMYETHTNTYTLSHTHTHTHPHKHKHTHSHIHTERQTNTFRGKWTEQVAKRMGDKERNLN